MRRTQSVVLLAMVLGASGSPAYAAPVVDPILFNAATNVEAEGDGPPGLAAGFSVSSAQGGTDDVEDAFGNADGDVEADTFIFGEGGVADDGDQAFEPGVETVDFIQWGTSRSVTIAGYRLALTDVDPFGRRTELVRFLVDGVERDFFDNDAATGSVDRPFGAPVTGTTFRLELTRTSNGPRIHEIDALVEPSTAAQININIAGGGANPMAPTETAGAPGVNDDNWTNLAGTNLAAEPIQVLGGDGLPVPGALASWTGFGQGDGLENGSGADDGHMLSSLFDARDYPAVALTVTGIAFDVYDVYAYHQGGAPDTIARVARFTIGTTDLFSLRRTDYSYVESTSTEDLGAATEPGSYVVFRGLSEPSLTLTVGGAYASDGFHRARFAGVQIVQATTTTTTTSSTTTSTTASTATTTTATSSTTTTAPPPSTTSTTSTTPPSTTTTLAPRDRRGRIHCPPGRYLVTLDEPAAVPILAVEVADPRSITVADVCPPTTGKRKPTRKGTRIQARWKKVVCAGLEGTVRLKARTDTTCAVMRGTLKAKRFKRAFEARRVQCGDGIQDPGEQCATLEGAPGAPAVDVTYDLDPVGAPAEDVVDGVILSRLDVYPEPGATVGQVNGAIARVAGRIVSMARGALPLTIEVPRQPDVAALRALADAATGSPGILVVTPAVEPQPLELPPGNAGANPTALAHAVAARFPAAWNARQLAAGSCAAARVPLVVGDVFPNPTQAGPRFSGFATQIPRFETPLGGYRNGASPHGLDVTLVAAARFDGAAPTGANPLPDCLDVHPVQLSGISELEAVRRLARRIAMLPPGARFVANASYGFYEPRCSSGTCAAADILGGTTPPLVRAAITYEWIHATRGRWPDFLLAAAAGNSFAHHGAVLYPGLGEASFSSVFNLATRLDPGFSGTAVADGVADAALWAPTAAFDPGGAPYPALLVTPAEQALLAVVEETLPVAGNVLVSGSRASGAAAESAFSERPADVLAVGEDVGLAGGGAGSGTSYAAPQVAGLVSYLWLLSSDLRALSVEATRSLLIATGQSAGGPTHLDAYAAILSLDQAAPASPSSAPVRLALLDENGDGAFDADDLFAFLFAYLDGFGDPSVPNTPHEPASEDHSRYDLNGDGYTGGAALRAAFDLDRVGSTRFGASQYTTIVHEIEGVAVHVNEQALTDLQILCWYATSPLFQDTAAARRAAFEDDLGPCVPLEVEVFFPATLEPGVPVPLTVTVGIDDTSGKRAVADAVVELEVTGGTVESAVGQTDAAGHFETEATAGAEGEMRVVVHVYGQPGGAQLAERTVTGFATCPAPSASAQVLGPAAAACCTELPDVTGHWEGTFQGGAVGSWSADLVQDGATLTGSVGISATTPPFGTSAAVEGTVGCSSIVFADTEGRGIAFAGEIDGSCMGGSWSASGFAGTWEGCSPTP